MPLDINVTLEKRPPPPNELPDHKDELFEFTVRELSFGDRVVARLKTNQHALMVDHVESAGWAELAGLRQGDLLLEIEGNSLRKISCFKTKMKNLIKLERIKKTHQVMLEAALRVILNQQDSAKVATWNKEICLTNKANFPRN